MAILLSQEMFPSISQTEFLQKWVHTTPDIMFTTPAIRKTSGASFLFSGIHSLQVSMAVLLRLRDILKKEATYPSISSLTTCRLNVALFQKPFTSLGISVKTSHLA
jgi:hypothetical protein